MVCWCVGRAVSPLTRPLAWSVQMVRGAQALAACRLLPPSHVINAHTHLVVEREAVVRVLDELVDGERGVVGLHHRVRHLLGLKIGDGQSGQSGRSAAGHTSSVVYIPAHLNPTNQSACLLALGEGRME